MPNNSKEHNTLTYLSDMVLPHTSTSILLHVDCNKPYVLTAICIIYTVPFHGSVYVFHARFTDRYLVLTVLGGSRM